MSEDLVTWLRAALDEDERVAVRVLHWPDDTCQPPGRSVLFRHDQWVRRYVAEDAGDQVIRTATADEGQRPEDWLPDRPVPDGWIQPHEVARVRAETARWEAEKRSRAWPKVDIRPDPRISNERPGWLTDDQQWRDQLQAMDLDDDIRWVERHWDMAGGAEPAVDTSWVRTESIGGGPMWPLVAVAVACPVLIVWFGLALWMAR